MSHLPLVSRNICCFQGITTLWVVNAQCPVKRNVLLSLLGFVKQYIQFITFSPRPSPMSCYFIESPTRDVQQHKNTQILESTERCHASKILTILGLMTSSVRELALCRFHETLPSQKIYAYTSRLFVVCSSTKCICLLIQGIHTDILYKFNARFASHEMKISLSFCLNWTIISKLIYQYPRATRKQEPFNTHSWFPYWATFQNDLYRDYINTLSCCYACWPRKLFYAMSLFSLHSSKSTSATHCLSNLRHFVVIHASIRICTKNCYIKVGDNKRTTKNSSIWIYVIMQITVCNSVLDALNFGSIGNICFYS